ncbi:hypothetical protein QVD17_28092 [Tagetes erecta]|uniref:Gnk2-homologous domain-containing protein n=1 Tax=Tagetes erecta TaxID=13708 RepID=A0AAD8NRS2_TARER|nr:hypothetical protein QVD17_28092 [Tagetes erecta]
MENKKIMLMTVMFMFMLRSIYCQCSHAPTTFQTNLRTLSDLLTKNAPLHDGFYNASVGKAPNEAFGILHCKANISKTDCANCLKSPIGTMDECPENEETLSTSCTMQLSHNNFFGNWSIFKIASYGENGLDDPLVFSKGFSMMEELANTVSDQPLMYQRAEIDVGVHGKRYGLVQCGRDLSKASCANCLEDRLAFCRSYAHNRTGWEVVGMGCSMWYTNGSKAYTHSSYNEPPPNVISGAQRCYGGNGITTIISLTISTVFTALLACDSSGSSWSHWLYA